MKLEDQVCSLDLAKRLKELGVKQESYFYWEDFEGNLTLKHLKPKSAQWGKLPSAFTVAEMGEFLPVTLGSPPKQIDVEYFKMEKTYQVQVSDYVERVPHLIFSSNMATEADARAGALVYLLEKGFVKP